MTNKMAKRPAALARPAGAGCGGESTRQHADDGATAVDSG